MTKLIKFFRSIKLAVVLILVISALSMIGIFLSQIPYDFSSSAEGTAWWMNNVAYAQYGGAASLLAPLGFFDIFHSVWFLGSVVLLLISILVCTLSRYEKLKTGSQKARLEEDEGFYEKGKARFGFETAAPLKKTYEKAKEKLKKERYFIAEKKQADKAFFAGDKNRASAFGTYFVHLSLFVFLIGIVLGLSLGFKNNSFIVFEDTARDVGYGTGLTFYLKSFADEYWADGTPKDYRSEAAVYKDGTEVANGVIRVNQPMEAEGVKFHQSFFGPAVKMAITDGEGNTAYDGNIALSGVSADGTLERPQGSIELDNGFIAAVIGSAENGDDPIIGAGEIGMELYDADMNFLGWLLLEKDVTQELDGYTFTYTGDLKFSGFLVSKDPGTGFIWIASILFLLGLVMIFYLPHRQVWIYMAATPENGTKVLLKLRSAKEFGLDAEAEKIILELKGDGQTDEY